MSQLTIIAFIGGLLTIAAPCILAVLPIILGSTIGQHHKLSPLAIVLGLTVSFTGFGVAFHYVSTFLGLSNNQLRNIALAFLIVFSMALIFPVTYEKILFRIKTVWTKIFPEKTGTLDQKPQQKGLINGFFVGTSLGLIWVPCAGPILGTILTLAVTQNSLSQVLTLLLAYSLGAGLPMLAIAYGGNMVISRTKFLKRKGELIQKIAGVIVLLGVLLIVTGLDTKIASALVNFFPNLNQFEQSLVDKNAPTGTQQKNIFPNLENSKESTLLMSKNNTPIVLFPKGQTAPEIVGTQSWINSKPLSVSELKGKVVIIDFWTYSCINCIRTLPYITSWYEKYKNNGLVIVGMHTPEFAFEKELQNVEKAVKKYNILYPVVQDNEFKTWNNYGNRYWPAKYVIDQEGYVRYVHFGEGQYDETEQVLQYLLNEGKTEKISFTTDVAEKNNQQNEVQMSSNLTQTPEIYFGTDRGDNYGNAEERNLNESQNFTLPKELKPNFFYLKGEWLNQNESIIPMKIGSSITIPYTSNKINIVADSKDNKTSLPAGDTPHASEIQYRNGVQATILLDGKPLPKEKFGKDVQSNGTVLINEARLYNLVDSGAKVEEPELILEFEYPGVEAFTFTFG